MKMKRFATGLVVGLISLFGIATPSAHAVLLYSGSLSTATGGLVGANQYATNTSFSWNVSFDHPHLQERMATRGKTMRDILETLAKGEGVK